MSNIGEIALQMIFIRDQLKFYHWAGTDLYSRHVASDSLVDSLTEKLDKFIETIQGSENKKLILPKKSMVFTVESDGSVIKLLQNFKISEMIFLAKLTKHFIYLLYLKFLY